MKQYTLTNRVLAGVSFLVAFLTYALTLQPSVPFWDCGEFSAATAWQQVPHPPGAPLWLIVARWFHLVPIGDPGWRINLAAATCSAFTAMLTYLIGKMLVERWRPYREGRSMMSYLPTFGGGLIAALAFTWSDSQWFNSVESEVYAGGIMLVALLIYLMMRWDQMAEERGHERYLLMIAYVLGLAIGVHLLALLVVPAVAMVIYFRCYKPTLVGFLALMGITAVAFFLIIYKGPLEYIPKLFASNAVFGILLLIALLGAVWWAIKENKPIIYMGLTSFLLIFLGFTTYTHILLRANAHPVMNENEPDHFSELVSYLGREQYGNAPNWPRRYQVEQYYRQQQDRYDEGTDGNWTPPRYNDQGQPVFDQVNTSGEINFMMKYQTYHMYIRYFLWNFVGRASDVQDAPMVAFSVSKEEKRQFISPTGYDDVFPIKFLAFPLLLGLIGAYYHWKRDWKMAFVFTTLFLFLGLFPTWQQNQQQPQPRERDYFYTGSFMIFALWIGLGATGLAEEVRERTSQRVNDGEGSESVAGMEPTGNTAAIGGVLALCLIAVPLNMGVNGWKFHDRSKNWVPWDYSYNILQSLEPNSILFTNGDNDTFPLWYLQDVAGIRQDVRVVNLSLGNTLWYIYQLKNERPWGAEKVPISFPDEMLKVSESDPKSLHYEMSVPPEVKVDVPATAMAWATSDSVKQAGTMTWTLKGQDMGSRKGEQLIRVQDKLIRDIITTNKFDRPVYMSSTVGPDAWAGLEEYFRKEGMAYRIMPVKQEQSRTTEPVNYKVMKACLMNTLEPDQFSQKQQYGFKFRNLTDTTAFFMEDHRRLMLNYRTLYTSLARYEVTKNNDSKAAIAALNKLEQVISPTMFAMPYPQSSEIAELYRQAGDKEKAAKYAKMAIASIDALGDDWQSDPYARSYNPIMVKAQALASMGEYDRAIQSYQVLLQQYPRDPNLRSQVEELRVEKFISKNDTAGAVAELKTMIGTYGAESDPSMLNNANALRARLAELTHTQVAPTDNTTVVDSNANQPEPAR